MKIKMIPRWSKSKRALSLFFAFTGSVVSLSLSAGSLQTSSYTSNFSSEGNLFYRSYCKEPRLFSILWDSETSCLFGLHSWRDKYPYLELPFFLSNLSRYSSINLIYYDPLFLDLSSSEMEEFATIVEGGGFSEDIQRVSLEDRLYSGEGRSWAGLAKRMLSWIMRRFKPSLKKSDPFEGLKNLLGMYDDIKEAIKETLVEYLGFSRWWAHWVVELAFFVFVG